jgi:hypothetical protein
MLLLCDGFLMTGLCYFHSKVNLMPEQSNCVNTDRIRRSLMVPKTDTHYNINEC